MLTEETRCRAEKKGVSFVQDKENQHANISEECLGFQFINKNNRVKSFHIQILDLKNVIRRCLREVTGKNLVEMRKVRQFLVIGLSVCRCAGTEAHQSQAGFIGVHGQRHISHRLGL